MKIYTTGQVSRICNVSLSTVNKWFDSGKLQGFRVPGSRHRRVPRDKLIEFLRNYDVPVTTLEDETRAKVLIVSRDQDLFTSLRKEMSLDKSFQVAVAHSSFEAGLQAETFRPDCVIVDFAMGKGEAAQICGRMQHKSDLADAILIAVAVADNLNDVDPELFNDSFKKPFDARLLAERVRTLIGGKKELD